MTTEATEDSSPARRARPIVAALAAAAIVAGLAVMSWLRRHETVAGEAYDAGNILGMHAAGDYPRLSFERGLGYAWYVALAGLCVVCAQNVRRRQPLVAALTSSLVLATVYVDSLTRWMTTVAGRFYFGMCDDALISMRYARNFVEGRGLVYNLGEHVDGFTNPLWTFLMTIPLALRMHEGTATLPISALGGVLLVVAALLGRAVLAREGAPIAVQVLVAFAIALDCSSIEFALIGLETPLLTMATTLVVYAAPSRPRLVRLGLALLCLARADGAVVAGALALWVAIDDSRTSGDPLAVVARRHAKSALVVAGVAGALVLWRLAVYGHPAPNTAYLKVYPLAQRVRTGLAVYGVRGLAMYGLPALAVLGLAGLADPAGRPRRARRLLLPVVAIWVYGMYVGADAFNYMRFLGPVTPLLWIALGLAASVGWERRPASVNVVAFVAFALVVPIRTEHGVLGLSGDHDGWIERVLVAAKTIERNVPEGSTVAVFWAGVPFYAPHHRFIDVLGKTEQHIAHEEVIHGAIPGHNKFDFPWIYDVRRPDVTFTSLGCDEVQRFLAIPTSDQDAILAHEASRQYFFRAASAQVVDPTFRALYVPNRVSLWDGERGAGHPLGCWYVRDGAPVPLTWQVARE